MSKAEVAGNVLLLLPAYSIYYSFYHMASSDCSRAKLSFLYLLLPASNTLPYLRSPNLCLSKHWRLFLGIIYCATLAANNQSVSFSHQIVIKSHQLANRPRKSSYLQYFETQRKYASTHRFFVYFFLLVFVWFTTKRSMFQDLSICIFQRIGLCV